MNLLVGTYSFSIAGMEANGEGIYSSSFDLETGAFGNPRLLANCINPSAMTLSTDGTTLFTGREVFTADDPALLSFRLSTDDKPATASREERPVRQPGEVELSKLSHRSITGELPCHLSFDAVHSRLASAQYWTGDVAIAGVAAGELQSPTCISRSGTGPNAQRQEGPHAHCVIFSDAGTVLHLVDLGTDNVVSHRLNDDHSVAETATLSVPAGSGPRHMVINSEETLAWVFCELDESLALLSRDGLGWKIDKVQPGFVPPDVDDGSGAAIRLSPDERHIYISGRRQSRIAGFTVDGSPIGEFDCGGVSPREFIISPDGNWIISANQDSNTLTSSRRDPDTGLLTPTDHRCAIGSPVALIAITNRCA